MTMGITSPTSTTGQILKNGSAVISFDSNNNASFAGNVAPLYNPTMRNRIINGDMRIAQRSTGSVTASTTGAITYGSCDRWAYLVSQGSKFTYQQSSTAPTGFTNSLLVTSSSAYTVGTSETFNILQVIEGFNCADLGFGTANAKTITISFWVQSSLTGTFGAVLCNYNINRTYPFTYTISSANTWTQISVTIAGDTTGTWNTNNSGGLQLMFSLGTGSSASGTAGAWSASSNYGATGATSVVGTNGATWYVTGVQLEAGSVATPFEQRLYGQELALCQRYLPAFSGTFNTFPAFVYSTTACLAIIQFPVTTRTAATGIYVSSAGHFISWRSNTSASAAGSVAFNASGTNSAVLDCTGYSASSFPGAAYMTNFQGNSSSALLYFTGCEL